MQLINAQYNYLAQLCSIEAGEFHRAAQGEAALQPGIHRLNEISDLFLESSA